MAKVLWITLDKRVKYLMRTKGVSQEVAEDMVIKSLMILNYRNLKKKDYELGDIYDGK